MYFEYEFKFVDIIINKVLFRFSFKNFFLLKLDLVEVKYDLLVGVDGVNSVVWLEMIYLDSIVIFFFKK